MGSGTEIVQRAINDQEGIIRPTKTKRDPRLGPDIILAMIQEDLDYLLSQIREQAFDHFNMGTFHLYRISHPKERTFALAGPFIGAPHAVMGMEKVIALGVKRIWAFGWCGSLRPSLTMGDLVIPAGALSEEGTSPHYPIGGRQPASDETLNRALEASLHEKGRAFLKGPVWTTDAPYRETPEKVLAYRERGALAVEMEMSALMTVAIYRKVRMAGLLVVSDELFDLRWRPGFSNLKRKEASRFAGRRLLDVVGSFETEGT